MKKLILELPILNKVICLILSCILFFSSIMAGSFAWASINNFALNEFEGSFHPGEYGVTLTKYEKDVNMQLTENAVIGAEFDLYKIADSSDTQDKSIGSFKTDENGKITVTGLEGGKYYFYETSHTAAYTFDKNAAGEEIRRYDFDTAESAASKLSYVTAYNRRLKSDLVIEKTVENADGSAVSNEQKELSFEFTVKFGDGKLYQYSIGDATEKKDLIDGKLHLKHGEKAYFRDLPVGTYYQVTEAAADKYSITSKNSSNNIIYNAENNVNIASFINTYSPEGGSSYGELHITKLISGDAADSEKSFKFKIKIGSNTEKSYSCTVAGVASTMHSGDILEIKADESIIISSIPTGTSYEVTEEDANTDGYTATVDTVKGEITTGASAVSFKNNKSTDTSPGKGSLSISKTVSGSDADLNKKFTFTVSFDDAAVADENKISEYTYTIDGADTTTLGSDGKITLSHDQTAVFADIPSSTVYNIQESSYTADGYVSNHSYFTGTIAKGENATVNVNNEKIGIPKLTIRKITAGTGADLAKKFEFTLLVNGKVHDIFELSNDETKEYSIPLGSTYEVIEKDYTGIGYYQAGAVNTFGTADKSEIAIEKTNKYIPGETDKTISVTVKKVWETTRTLPASVDVCLYENGKKHGEAITLNAANSWTHTWENLDKASTWTVDEVSVPSNYTKTISGSVTAGFVITNTYFSGGGGGGGGGGGSSKTSVSVKKEWDDNNNEAKKRPDSINVQLYRNGAVYGSSVTLNEANGWKYTWSSLSKSYKWTVDELSVPESYEKTISGSSTSGFVIKNTYRDIPDIPDDKPGEKTVSVRKKWAGDPNPNQPIMVEASLYRNGIKYAGIVLNDANNWTHTWTGLDDDALWTVNESGLAAGYTKNITGNADIGFMLTNIYDSEQKPDTISFSVNKVWVCPSGVNPPETATIVLYKDSVEYDRVVLDASSDWVHSWVGLESGSVWTIDEIRLPAGYTKSITGDVKSGFTVTNTYVPSKQTQNKPSTGTGSSRTSGAPKTGDTSDMQLWFIIMILSAFALKFVLFDFKNIFCKN